VAMQGNQSGRREPIGQSCKSGRAFRVGFGLKFVCRNVSADFGPAYKTFYNIQSIRDLHSLYSQR